MKENKTLLSSISQIFSGKSETEKNAPEAETIDIEDIRQSIDLVAQKTANNVSNKTFTEKTDQIQAGLTEKIQALETKITGLEEKLQTAETSGHSTRPKITGSKPEELTDC